MIEFWYEFASTYSYPAAMRVEHVAAGQGVEVTWRPFLLGPIFRELGWQSSPFNEQPAKGAYMWRDMERSCDALGLALTKPDPFPQNSLLGARVALALPDTGARAAFTKALYHLEFGEGLSLSDPKTLTRALAEAGQDADAVLARAGDVEGKAALRRATETAVAHGIFGAPTWRCTDGEIFWGNDRLEDALAWQVSLVRRA